jgi:hypothetical protein
MAQLSSLCILLIATVWQFSPADANKCDQSDEVALLQTAAKLSRGDSREQSPNYALFSTQGSAPNKLTVKLACDSKLKDVPMPSGTYHLSSPLRNGQSGVLYHIDETSKYLMKFARSVDNADSFQGDLELATALPDYTPATWACTGEVLSADTSSNALGVLLGGPDNTFPVLIKDNIVGVELGDIMMTLASPKGTKHSMRTVVPPPTCNLCAANEIESKCFNYEKYKKVKELAEGSKRRVFLQQKVQKELKCVLAKIVDYCVKSHNAVWDTKAANWMYGRANGEGDPRLFLVDGLLTAGAGTSRSKCLKMATMMILSSDFPCKGPYWPLIPSSDIDLQQCDG